MGKYNRRCVIFPLFLCSTLAVQAGAASQNFHNRHAGHRLKKLITCLLRHVQSTFFPIFKNVRGSVRGKKKGFTENFA